MRYRTRWLGLVVALAALTTPPPAATAQGTAADSAHANRSAAPLDTVRTALARFCATVTGKKTAYLCVAPPRIVADQIARESALKVPNQPPPPPPPPAPSTASVTIHGTGATLAAGSTMQLIAEPKSAAGVVLTTPVRWAASPASVATISGTGLLTGVAAGTVTVTATADSVAGVRTFTVTGGATPPPVTPPDTTTTQPPPVTPPPAPSGTLATLPRATPTPVYPACARTNTLTMVSSLQAALDGAQFGDCIALPAGTQYVGNFTWKNRPGTGYVTLLTATTSPLPPPGTRMTPARCAALGCAKILSPNYSPAIGTDAGAHGLIVRGIEVSYTSAAIAGGSNVLFRISDNVGPQTRATTPYDFTIDRSVVRGLPTMGVRRCILLNSSNSIVIDSWVDECHDNNSDSQAILGYAGTFGVLIQNNTLFGGHEPVMWGGADAPSADMIPTAVTLRGNHIGRPATWYKVWIAKNCLETKDIIEYLIESNVIENCPADAQAGFALVWKSENQSGTAPWTTTSDVTFRYNWVRNISSAFNLSGKGSSSNPNVAMARVTICDNLVERFRPNGWGGDGFPLQLLSQATNVTLCRNTFRNDATSLGAISMDGPPAAIGLVMTNNVMHNGQYGAKGSGGGIGTSSLTTFAPGFVWTNNVMVGASCAQYPATTSCPATFPGNGSATTPGVDTMVVKSRTSTVVVDATALAARKAVNPRQLTTPWHPTPAGVEYPLNPK